LAFAARRDNCWQHYREGDGRRDVMTLLVLIGPKGSGKTHVGTVIEARLGVRFIRVEPIFAALNDQVEAFVEVERQIRGALAEVPVVAIESTGIVPEHVGTLRARYQPVRLIGVHASAETCFRRYTARDACGHIPISSDEVREINERAARVRYNWDCVLDNDAELTDEEIAEAVGAIL
jgi:shikimate kinase